jgi:hypothetical protein
MLLQTAQQRPLILFPRNLFGSIQSGSSTLFLAQSCSPGLPNAEGSLTTIDLEDKKKVDQDLFSAVINNYNDSTNDVYSRHAFSSIDNFMDASIFDDCQPHDWEKAKKKFGDLISEYEALFNFGRPRLLAATNRRLVGVSRIQDRVRKNGTNKSPTKYQ